MRPKSVRLGEQIYAISIVLTLVLAVVGWEQAVVQLGFATALGANLFQLGLQVLLLILATRKGSRVALWLLAAVTAMTLVGFLMQVSAGVVAPGLFGVLTTVQAVLSLVAVVLLFRPSARAWFAERRAMRA